MRIDTADRVDRNGSVRSDMPEKIEPTRFYARLALGGEDVTSDAEISSLPFNVLCLICSMH